MWKLQVNPSSAIKCFVLLLCSVSMFFDALYSMVTLWVTTDTYMHGAFVIPLVIMLATQMDKPREESKPLGVFLSLVISLAWGIGAVIATQSLINVLEQVMFILLPSVIVLVALGWRYLWHYRIPLILLFLCIPFGDFLVPYLQSFTADVSVWMLRSVGVPVLHNGWYISIAEANFRVAEACSGINFLISTFVVSIFYSFSYMTKVKSRVLFMALGILVPLLANCVRVFLIVIVAHLGNVEAATGFDHVIYGWFFFAIILCILFVIGRFLSEPPVISDNGASYAEIFDLKSSCGVLILLASVFFVNAYVAQLRSESFNLENVRSLEKTHDWDIKLGAKYPGADSFLVTHHDDAVVIHAVYLSESQGKKMISYNNQLFNKDVWSIQGQGQIDIQNHVFDMFDLVDINGNKAKLYRRYLVDSSWFVGSFNVKWAQVKSRVLGNSFGGTVELIFVPEHMDRGTLLELIEQ